MSLNLSLVFSEFNLRVDKAAEQKIYEFENFRLDAGHLMLSRNGEEIPLAPKAVETLIALVERRGEIVSKDELLSAVWPDTAVEESNLFLYLSQLRKALEPKEGSKPWIETLRRRGYRFNGDVHSAPNTGESNGESSAVLGAAVPSASVDLGVSLSTPKSPTRRWSGRQALFVSVSALALVAVSVSVFVFLGRSRPVGSVAVKPFVNETGDPELEYLSDGLTINLIGSLLRIPDLEVKAYSTMFRYKGSNLDAAAIGKELNVDAVLSPSMAQRGDDLTLNLELVDSKTENSLWQKTYNVKASQIGVLQRDVIRDVLRELSIDPTDSAAQKIARDYTENAEATRLYYQGLFHIRKITEPEIREGIGYLWKAIEHDPSYAPAYAMIASAHRSLTLCCDAHPSELAEAKRAAMRAIELDENLAEAHSALAGSLYQHDWNFAEAEKHYLRALELNPKSAMAHFLYADFLGRMDRRDEAAAERGRAVELEPFSPLFNAFALLHVRGDPKTMMEKAQFVIDLDPNFHFSHFMAAGVYRRLKMYPEALAEYRRAKELAPEQTWSDVTLSGMLVDMGEIDQARAILGELLRRSESRYVPPFHIAAVYNLLGDTEQYLAWLEKAYQVRDPKLTFLKTSPGFKKLYADPHFQDICRRVGF